MCLEECVGACLCASLSEEEGEGLASLFVAGKTQADPIQGTSQALRLCLKGPLFPVLIRVSTVLLMTW